MSEIILAVSGSPCTSKTTLADKLSESLGFEVVHLSDFVKAENLSIGFDERRDTSVVDVAKLARRFRVRMAGRDNLIVDGLLSHLLPVTHVIVQRASPLLLEKRMLERGYSREKIKENLEAEYLGVILHEALERCKNVLELDSTRGVDVKEIKDWLSKGGVRVVEVDWSEEFMETLNH